MIGCVKCFDSNKVIYFKVSNQKLLQRYTKMWEKISSLVGKEFGNKPKPVYGDNG